MIFMISNVASQYSFENELKGKTKGKIKIKTHRLSLKSEEFIHFYMDLIDNSLNKCSDREHFPIFF